MSGRLISATIAGTTKIINFTLSIQVLTFIQFLFGLYQDFKCNKLLVQLAVTYCIIFNTIVPITFLVNSSTSFDEISAFCEHYIFVLFSFYAKEGYLGDYIAQIMRIDIKLGLKTKKVETLFLRIVCVFTFILFYLYYSSGLSQSSRYHICARFVTFTQFMSLIPTIIMLELFRNRVHLLQTSIEFCFAHDTNFREESIAFKLKKIKKFIYIYKYLLNNIMNNFNHIKFVVLIKFATAFLHTMAMAQILVPNISNGIEVSGTLIYLALNLSLICVPPLLAELAANEVDKIKTILTDQLLTCTDAALRAGLEDALTYLRVRHFKVVVWRAIPVGVSTLLAFVALCTNYLIVLMQFMKS